MPDGIGDFLDITIRWDDRTAYGSLLSPRLHETVRRDLHPRLWTLLGDEMAKPPGQRRRFPADALCRLVREERLGTAHRRIVGDPCFWRPDPDLVQIAGFTLASEESGSVTHLPLETVPLETLRDWLRDGGGDAAALIPLHRSVEAACARAGFRRSPLPYPEGRPLMVGHACVTWSDGDLRLWTDPFLPPKRLRYPTGQQPFSPLDAPEDHQLVLITHSHPDHFAPSSLLLFPRDATIIVPCVEAETPLTLDIARRVRELGFTDVRALASREQVRLGGFTVTACPFYGEQPLGPYATPGDRTDRNQGATYHVAGPEGLTALFLADAGADPAGSSLALARELRATLGPVDFVFGNHRRWRIHPPQFITTSVPQSLCYVPDAELGVPQLTMLTPEQLVEVGEILAARRLVPYAMGNAPWFAEIGLGPADHLSGSASAFDALLDEASAADVDTLVVPAARLTILTPGDVVGRGGVSRDPQLVPIDFAAFSPRSEAPEHRALALGLVQDPQTVRDLIALTRVDPASYAIATPGFLQLATTDPAGGAFLWELASRLVPHPRWYSWEAVPRTSGLFGEDLVWLARFEAAHREACCILRDGGDVAAMRPLVDGLRTDAPPDALRAIAWDLLGVTVSPGALAGQCRGPAFAHGIPLPSAAGELSARFGAAAVTAALLVVKLIHNTFLTIAAQDNGSVFEEAEMFRFLLADDTTG